MPEGYSERMSERLKGHITSVDTRRKISQSERGKVVPPEVRLKMSVAHKGVPLLDRRGKNAPGWKGGVTPKHLAIRMSLEYKQWREAIFQRDKYTCVWCGAKGFLNADHIKPFSQYPELRFEIDNGRTLCVPCHRNTDTFGSKANKELTTKL